jgi:O-acetyl-ADP-ribose deacetylase (regulator of RNase III)
MARRVIHTVGPIWRGGQESEAEILSSCYKNSLSVMAAEGLNTIAFPSISTGAYGYPIEEASRVALKTVKGYVEREGRPAQVTFVLFSEEDLKIYVRALGELG